MSWSQYQKANTTDISVKQNTDVKNAVLRREVIFGFEIQWRT
jgi:hypothetical protein